MPTRSRPGDVRAAGAVVLRKGRVLLVHRPAYDDWSFPKGKLDRGEQVTAAAVREVAEETGLRIRLGVPLSTQAYPTGSRTKLVEYWVGRVLGGHDVSGYHVNQEIDDVRWVPVTKAPRLLTYKRDRHTLAEALESGRKTTALVLLRHGQARSRSRWRGPDPQRPLLAGGRKQAVAAVPVLEAYGVTRAVTSSSTRCLESVSPFADHAGVPLVRCDALTEEDATPGPVAAIVEDLVRSGENAVLCTHRPVLPMVYDALGLPPEHQATGEIVVIHHRRGKARAVERHLG